MTAGREGLRSRAQWWAEFAGARSGGLPAAVIHLDIDRFHRINNRHGQPAGDRILDAVTGDLLGCLGDGASMARIGDIFLISAIGGSAADAVELATRLHAAVRESTHDGGPPLTLNASVGVAWQASSGTGDLVEQAFLACRWAKANALGTVVVYERSVGAEVSRRNRIEDELRAAVADGQFLVAYQPKVSLVAGAVVGVEALVRWNHPLDGLRGADTFIADAEAAGLLADIGEVVLADALRLAERWLSMADGDPVRVWVNLSAQQLRQGAALLGAVRERVESGRITARSIGFEVTESALLDDLPGVVGTLTELREMGVEIALDDFGTGYSSLSYLRRLPVSVVKIDRQFVEGIGHAVQDEAIIEAVVDLSHALGLSVVAEGVERAEQLEAIRRMGVDQAQGFLFHPPTTVERLEPLLGLAWCGAQVEVESAAGDRRAADLPGYGSPRARLLLAALDAAQDSVVVTAAVGDDPLGPPIVYANPAFERETGLTAADVIGQPVWSLSEERSSPNEWPPPGGDRSRQPLTIELVNRRADGSTFVCETTLSPVFDERGVRTHWLHVRRDLSRRRAIEGERANLEHIIERTDSLVCVAERSGQIVYLNAAARRAVGLLRTDPLQGWTPLTMVAASDRPEMTASIFPQIERTGYWRGDFRLEHRYTKQITEVRGEVHEIDDPLRPGGRLFAAVGHDVTALNRLSRLQRRRQELRAFGLQLARRALDVDTVDEELIDDQLVRQVAELFDADMAYVARIDTDPGILRPTAWWSRGTSLSDYRESGDVDLDRMPEFMAMLRGSTGVQVTKFDDDRPWAAELKEVYGPRHHAVHRFVALRAGSALLGTIGICNLTADRDWSIDETDSFREIADTIANVYARQRAEVAMRDHQAKSAAMLASVAEIVLVIDEHGVIRFVNQRAEMLGYRFRDLFGTHFIDWLHPDDRHSAEARFVSWGTVPVEPTTVRVRAADGRYVWFDVELSSDVDPLVGGYMVSIRNVTLQRAIAQHAERQAEFGKVAAGFAEWALNVRPGAVVAELGPRLELLARALSVDVSFASLLKGSRISTLGGWASGHLTDRFYPPDTDLPLTAARYRTLEPLIVHDLTTHDEPWAGEAMSLRQWFRSGVAMPLVAGGECLGALSVNMVGDVRQWEPEEIQLVRDVSETVSALLARQQAEDTLRVNGERMAGLLEIAQIALDLDAGAFIEQLPTVADSIAAILQVDLVSVDYLDADRRHLHKLTRRGAAGSPADVQQFSLATAEIPELICRWSSGATMAVADMGVLDEPWAAELADLIGPTRSLLSIPMQSAGQWLGAVVLGSTARLREWTTEEQTVGRILGEIVAQVLARASVDEALRASEARYKMISETAADVVMLISDTGTVTYASPSSTDLLGLTPEELAGRRVRSLVHPDFVGSVTTYATSGLPRWSQELMVMRSSGSALWVVIEVAAVLDGGAEPSEYRVSMRDISERKRLEAELADQALHDPLTGLANRILLQDRLRAAAEVTAGTRQVAVLMADMDGFKAVNDTYGHDVGDAVLRLLAARLQRLCRAADTLARTGGDEFVVLCPDTPLDEAQHLAGELVVAAAEPMVVGDLVLKLGISVGVSQRHGDRIDPDWMLIEADHATYSAKRAGRGRVCVAPSALADVVDSATTE